MHCLLIWGTNGDSFIGFVSLVWSVETLLDPVVVFLLSINCETAWSDSIMQICIKCQFYICFFFYTSYSFSVPHCDLFGIILHLFAFLHSLVIFSSAWRFQVRLFFSSNVSATIVLLRQKLEHTIHYSDWAFRERKADHIIMWSLWYDVE